MEVATCCTTSTATSLRSAPSTSRHCARSAEGLTASYGERIFPHACKVAAFPFRSASFLVSCLFDLFYKVQTSRPQRLSNIFTRSTTSHFLRRTNRQHPYQVSFIAKFMFLYKKLSVIDIYTQTQGVICLILL